MDQHGYLESENDSNMSTQNSSQSNISQSLDQFNQSQQKLLFPTEGDSEIYSYGDCVNFSQEVFPSMTVEDQLQTQFESSEDDDFERLFQQTVNNQQKCRSSLYKESSLSSSQLPCSIIQLSTSLQFQNLNNNLPTNQNQFNNNYQNQIQSNSASTKSFPQIESMITRDITYQSEHDFYLQSQNTD